MRTLFKVMIVFFLVALIAIFMISSWIENRNQEMYNQSYQSSYSYSVEISPNATLKNMTLYLPLMVLNNTSAIGEDIIKKNFNQNDTSWIYSLVETEHGLMLSMKTDEIDPSFHSREGYVVKGSDPEETRLWTSDEYSNKTPIPDMISFSAMVNSNRTIDTMDPLINDLVLRPKYNVRHTSDEGYSFKKQYDYESILYAEYEASPYAIVDITIHADGENSWWIMGWQGNDYSDWMTVQLSGPQKGWTKIDGFLGSGGGVYRDT
jgi:hypothetical protein